MYAGNNYTIGNKQSGMNVMASAGDVPVLDFTNEDVKNEGEVQNEEQIGQNGLNDETLTSETDQSVQSNNLATKMAKSYRTEPAQRVNSMESSQSAKEIPDQKIDGASHDGITEATGTMENKSPKHTKTNKRSLKQIFGFGKSRERKKQSRQAETLETKQQNEMPGADQSPIEPSTESSTFGDNYTSSALIDQFHNDKSSHKNTPRTTSSHYHHLFGKLHKPAHTEPATTSLSKEQTELAKASAKVAVEGSGN